VFRGQKIVALIEATGLVCVERFKDYPQLGRFTLRDEGMIDFFNSALANDPTPFSGKTIAIGKVKTILFQF
jgi:hypothetical protein